MRKNPFSEEQTRVQSVDISPRRERMDDLPTKPAPQPVSAAPSPDTSAEFENAEARQEEARTVRYAIGKLNDFLQWFVAVLEVTLLVRFLLMLIGARSSNPFAGFLYALTSIMLFPFSNIIPNAVFHDPQAFEGSTLIAMLIYWLVFWAIRRFLRILISSPEEPVA